MCINTESILCDGYTTTEMNAISTPDEGMMIYNSTLKKYCFYNGSAWEEITSTLV